MTRRVVTFEQVSIEVDGLFITIDGVEYFAMPARDTKPVTDSKSRAKLVDLAPQKGKERKKHWKQLEPKPLEVARKTKETNQAGCGERILVLLGQRPMTSAELVVDMGKRGYSSGSVYTSLTSLRKGSMIETRDDGDGDKKNFKL